MAVYCCLSTLNPSSSRCAASFDSWMTVVSDPSSAPTSLPPLTCATWWALLRAWSPPPLHGLEPPGVVPQ
ncbi:hypothetical protein XELAEV_18026891mg [Xenopus laevis]|uniref:Uncharacterized protein n=1 Tax=Xenopus laevis TaxID=8355 RepID=A0A974HJG3_XENLA|nr:hypothetical protein XELAEV_18026891mg [Xenopus laevis]